MRRRRRSSPSFCAPPPSWTVTFFSVCTPRRTARKRTAGPLPHPFRNPRYPRDRLKPPRAFPGAPWATRVSHIFICVGLHSNSRNLYICHSCLISWASAGKEAPMPAVYTARRGMPLSDHPRTFRSRRGWISAVWRGNHCGCSPTYWPRQDARRSPDGWPNVVARLQCGSRRAQTSFERTLGVWPARRLSPEVSPQTAASGRWGHANWVQHPKAGTPLRPARKRYSIRQVCPTRCPHLRPYYSITRRRYWTSGGNTWAHRERPPAPTRSAGKIHRFPILNVGECDVHSDRKHGQEAYSFKSSATYRAGDGGGGGAGEAFQREAGISGQPEDYGWWRGSRLSGLFPRHLRPVPEPPTHRGYRYGKQGLEFLENHSFRLVAVPTELRGLVRHRRMRVCIASMFTSPLGVFLRSCESPFPEKNLILGIWTLSMPGPTIGFALSSACPWKRTRDKS